MFIRTSLFCAALAASTLATAADSDIDTSFGIFSTGHNVVPINGGGGNGDTVAELLVAPDGSLYVVGTSDVAGGQTRISLVHLHANGQLDNDFGSNGHYVGPTINIKASAAAFDTNGDILVAGTRRISGDNTDFTVCRLRGAGVAQFGDTGLPCMTLAFDLGGTLQDTARDIVLLDDRRIALIGSAVAANGVVEAAVAIINSDGSPYVPFGPGGKRHWIQNGLHEVNLYAGVLDFDVIQVVGDAKEDGNPRLGAFSAWVNLSTGAHLNDKIDYLADANGQAFYRDVVLDNDPNLRILAVGGVLQNGKYRGVLTRVNQFGDYDTAWDNGNGYATINAGESVQLTRIVKQSDGKLLVAGMLQETGFTGSSLFVGRYNASGSLDAGTFNLLQGYREIDFQMPGNYDYGAVLALQSGQPVIAGSVQASGSNTDYDVGVARLRNDLIFANRFGSSPQDD
jgi:uncharacterized delta-60 repeat protein